MDSFTRNIFQMEPSSLSFSDVMMMDVDEFTDIMTPPAKRRLPSLVDEDSGLGMDIDEVEQQSTGNTYSETPKFSLNMKSEILEEDNVYKGDMSQSSECVVARRSLFNKQRRSLAAENEGSYSKRQQQRRTTLKKTVIKKSLSFGDSPISETSQNFVKSVVNKLVEDQTLTGDGSQTCCLPTIPGKHSDLKSITCDTVAHLMAGRYDDVIGTYRLIDCRYPYEYEGGHIKGAENIHKQASIPEILDSAESSDDGKRRVLIFYCEFSSERGPKMCRKLRSADRELNKDNYPYLNYPEIYVMHNGYKAFYESYKSTGLCSPDSYKPMLHKDHSDDLRHFRSKSKSWSSGERRRSVTHRLRF